MEPRAAVPLRFADFNDVFEVIAPQMLILSLGITLLLADIAPRITGPFTLTFPHVEIPVFTLHVGNAPTAPVAPKTQGLPPRPQWQKPCSKERPGSKEPLIRRMTLASSFLFGL